MLYSSNRIQASQYKMLMSHKASVLMNSTTRGSPMLKPFLVASRISNKTLGAVYAASIESAKDIAGTLWANDKATLSLFDLRENTDGAHAVTATH